MPDNTSTRLLPGPALLVLLSGSALMNILFNALGPVLPLMAAALGKNGVFVAQLMMSTPAMGVIVGGLVSGWLIEKVGARPLLMLTLGGYALFGSAGLYLQTTPLLLGSRLLFGVCVVMAGTSITTLIGEFFNDESRARLLGFQETGACVAGVAALLLSGFLGQSFGWRAPFAIYAIVLPLIGFAAMIPRRSGVGSAKAVPTDKKAISRELLGLWPVWLMLVPLYVALLMNAIQTGLVLNADGVSNPTWRAAIVCAAPIAAAVTGSAYGFLHTRLSMPKILAMVLGLMGIGYALVGAHLGIAFVAAGIAIVGAAAGMLSPHIATYLLGRVSPAARSRAIGLMFTIVFVADFLNPLLITPMKAQLGLDGVFLIVAALLITATLVVFVRSRSPVHALA